MINQQIVKVAVLFLLTFTPIVNYSQNIIQGIVIDSETKEPLLGANVVLAESKKRTITDLNGRFQFTVPSSNGYKRIIITYIGYHTFNLDLTEVKLFDKPIIIKLIPAINFEILIFSISSLPHALSLETDRVHSNQTF